MSKSQFVCWKDGLPVTGHRNSWRHALGGGTGSIPPSKKHHPVVISREEYDKFNSLETPPEISRAIAERMRMVEQSQPVRDLSVIQTRMLGAVRRMGEATARDLGERTRQTSDGAAYTLRSLVNRGLVEHGAEAKDHRATYKLTSYGASWLR